MKEEQQEQEQQEHEHGQEQQHENLIERIGDVLKYAEVPLGVVPCSPAPRNVPLVSTWPRAVVAVEVEPSRGLA